MSVDKAILGFVAERLRIEGSLRIAAEQPGAQAGLQNTNVVIETDEKKMLLRLFPAADTALQRNEEWVLGILERKKPGLAPRCLLSDCQRGVLVEEFVANSGALAPAEITDAVLNQTAVILAQLHSVNLEDINCSEHRLPNDVALFPEDDLESRFVMHDEKMAVLWKAIGVKTAPHVAMFAALARDMLVHGDAHCGNVLKVATTLRMIDWEGAHVGCGLEDLGCFVTVVFPRLSMEKTELFIDAYRNALAIAAPAWLNDPAVLWPMLRMFKLRKLVRMVAFFNNSLANPSLPAAAAAALRGGAAFFISCIEAELQEF